MFMVLNPTPNNISDMSWRAVLLVETTRVPVENYQQILSHNVVPSIHFTLSLLSKPIWY